MLPCGPSLNAQPAGLMASMEWALDVETGCRAWKLKDNYDTRKAWRDAHPGAAKIMRRVNELRKDARNN